MNTDLGLPADELIDPVASAAAVRLRYVSDDEPGISRRRRGRGYSYTAPTGERIDDAATLARIKELKIPPAWTNVWICTCADGHLQATGRDGKGRKQYRYHPRWQAIRNQVKYSRLQQFAQALPELRRTVAADMALPGLPRRKLVATVVKLLETTLIRIGNDEYAATNHSYGLTTLRTRHLTLDGAKVRFTFTGKRGVKHRVGMRDRRLAAIMRRCHELPGQRLFQYVDAEGNPQPIDSADVNDYLQTVTAAEFTAKDFRTWGGTVAALEALQMMPPAMSPTQAKNNIAAAVKAVAKRLGNTPAVCRSSYIHPLLLDAYGAGELDSDGPAKCAAAADSCGLSDSERAVLNFLQSRSV